MGSSLNIEHLCRLCGEESLDLVKLFDRNVSQRNLVPLIKKYLKVTVTVRDELPQQVCGPCITKLDEVAEFVNICTLTQIRYQQIVKGHLNAVDNRSYGDLIMHIKEENSEDHDEQKCDDCSDDEYLPRNYKKQNGRRKRVKKSCNKPLKDLDITKVCALKGLESDHEEAMKGTNSNGERLKDDEFSGQECEITNSSRTDGDGANIGVRSDGKSSTSVDIKRENQPKIPVRCYVCKSTFDHSGDLEIHCMEAHQLKEAHFMCIHCPQKFSKVSSITSHMRKKHRDSLQRCPKCKKLYSSHYLWTRHMLVHTNMRPFTCTECDKKFKSKNELNNHKKTHKPCEERYTHCCEVCGKRFTQKANLENHLKLHSGKRPFACEFCGKTFSQRGNMEEHRRIHTGEKPFACNACGVRFSRQGQLSTHRKMHTGEKPHKCRFCEKEFLRLEVLRKHENVHTNTRPYKCSYCEKRFRDQGKRKVHERLHTGERPYECDICKRGFCESGNLKKHKRIHMRTLGTLIPSSVEEEKSRINEVGSGNVIVACGEESYSSTPNSQSNFANAVVARQNLELVTLPNPPLIIVSDPATTVSERNPMSCPALPLQVSVNTPVLNNGCSLNAHQGADGRDSNYPGNSSLPIHSLAWSHYHSE
ncbi:hypothetical protein SK128_007361 [Halocaridina rubra]|uniref:Uncharacterized protein n=1 Tax=Halocaridina rubra TaxID=373956 RepID=A0AAN9AAD7_HALRR